MLANCEILSFPTGLMYILKPNGVALVTFLHSTHYCRRRLPFQLLKARLCSFLVWRMPSTFIQIVTSGTLCGAQVCVIETINIR